MASVLKKFHLFGIWKRICFFLINHVFVRISQKSSNIRCRLLRSLGHEIGSNTMIVSPVQIDGHVSIGRECWINCGFRVYGNGTVTIGDRCDIASGAYVMRSVPENTMVGGVPAKEIRRFADETENATHQ